VCAKFKRQHIGETEGHLLTAVAVAQPLSKKLLTKRETDRMSRFLFLVWEDVPAYRQAG
jgi:hypothetical protein